MNTSIRRDALRLLDFETQGLLTRLASVRPFALYETMVEAAAPSVAARVAIERHMAGVRRVMRRSLKRYRAWLRSPEARAGTIAAAQRRFAFLRLRFNAMLSQVDIFADVFTQRSESDTGVWLSGLDVLAEDALSLPGAPFRSPPIICYVDRGLGAAIRRARTRLPGGGTSPVAVIRVPRERMVGAAVAGSLVHEVGHQGADLLDLVSSLRPELRALGSPVRELYERWISEIVADFWSVARVGVISTLGLMGVVSLPRAFVFRVALDDPHPFPWIRVRLSCVMGEALYPDPQWRRIASLWEAYYPLAPLDARRRLLIAALEAGMPSFVDLLVHHRPASLGGMTLGQAVAGGERQPARLRALHETWRTAPEAMRRAPASLVAAALGQARADGKITPESESRALSGLLRHWALKSTLNSSTVCAVRNGALGTIAAAV